MQAPVQEIPGVIKALVQAKDADEQLLALRKYFSPDASFDHMLCAVPQGPQSRDNGIAPIYQWLRIISNSTIRVESVGEHSYTYARALLSAQNERISDHLKIPHCVHRSTAFDEKKNKVFVDASQTLRPNLFPASFWTPTLRILVILQLHKGADDLFYVNRQEDYYNPQVLPGQIVPGGYTVLLTIKFLVGVACFFMTWFVQTLLGYWKPSRKALHDVPAARGKRISG